MIVVTGATGNVGGPTIEILRSRGLKVRGVSRHPEHPDDVAADLADLDAVKAALAGATAVFSIVPAEPNQLDMEKNVIEAAKAAGPQVVARLSSLGANPEGEDSVSRVHGQAEKLLEESGLPYTHVRGNYFMQMFLTQTDTVANQGLFATCCVGSAQVGFIDTRDIAEVAAKVLTSTDYVGKTLKLTGPELLTFADCVSKLGTAVGKDLKFYDMNSDDYRNILIGAGVSEYLAGHIIGLYQRIGSGGSAKVTDDVTTVLGVPARTFDVFAVDYADRFKPKS